MKKRGSCIVAPMVLALVACGGGDDSASPSGCQKDTDCASGRICEMGACVNADNTSADDTSSTDGTGGSTASSSTEGSGGSNATSSDGSDASSSTSGGTATNTTGGAGGTSSTSATSTDGNGGTGGGDTEPVCRTVDVVNPAAAEKINAAFCFGLAYNDDYSCVFDPVYNVTFCDGVNTAYYVVWMTDQYGDVYDALDDSLIGQIGQGPTGAFIIAFGDVAQGECTVVGDVATLCVEEL